MNKLIDFLQSQSSNEEISENSIDQSKLSDSLNDIRNKISSIKIEENKIVQLKSQPQIEKSQIWLCKQEYSDAFGDQIIGKAPYLVYIVSDVNSFGGSSVVRVQPITPFVDSPVEDEVLIKDDSIVGFEFLIETWNEQPILTDLLDEFVGNLEVKPINEDNFELKLTKSQKEFRKAEIRNTAYLRQSVISHIEFNEQKEEEEEEDNKEKKPKGKVIAMFTSIAVAASALFFFFNIYNKKTDNNLHDYLAQLEPSQFEKIDISRNQLRGVDTKKIPTVLVYSSDTITVSKYAITDTLFLFGNFEISSLDIDLVNDSIISISTNKNYFEIPFKKSSALKYLK